MALEIGARINAIEAEDQDSVTRKIDFSGVNVLYFYPKDDTPGCTKEACGFRDDISEFADRGVRVWGVSTDGVASHKKFTEKYKLNFPLLSDKDKKICKAFDVPATLTAKRITYIIVDSIVVYVDPAVRPEGHSRALLEKIDELT
ncbi:MAG: peroxiredoxin [Candidatus Aenigmarchaeota archaeon]|nr:peroxiredoxin [Candidatus Aenigmarchaeota archaeon]